MTPKRRGFTLVELNLSMIFVALLLIGIAALTMHVSRLYQRGILLKDVNYIGREVMSQMRSDIAMADPSSFQHVITPDRGGRICLGNVSYLYNTALGLQANDSQTIRKGSGASAPPIALVRVNDPSRAWCMSSPLAFNIPDTSFATVSTLAATELIPRDQFATIAVHHINLPIPTASSDKLALHQLSVRLGTSNLAAIDGDTCRPPSESSSDFEACYVVDYTTVIRTGGAL